MRQQQVICLAALPFAFIALLAGLLALSAHPIAAVLLLLGDMGLSLRLAAAVCGEQRMVGGWQEEGYASRRRSSRTH